MAEVIVNINDEKIYDKLNQRFQFAKGSNGELGEVVIDPDGLTVTVTVEFVLTEPTFNDVVWDNTPPS